MFTMLNNPNSMELFVLTHLGGKSDTRKQSSPSFNSFAPVCLLSVFWWLFAERFSSQRMPSREAPQGCQTSVPARRGES